MVTNLLDGVNQTRDDLHMWLTPFTPSHPHTITITFTTIISLALLRIWVGGHLPSYVWLSVACSVELQQVSCSFLSRSTGHGDMAGQCADIQGRS